MAQGVMRDSLDQWRKTTYLEQPDLLGRPELLDNQIFLHNQIFSEGLPGESSLTTTYSWWSPKGISSTVQHLRAPTLIDHKGPIHI